ncbi:MAG: aldehyde dehydrogenase family protein [Bacteroidetes bacterium]|nr:MAG: aldehyde dehydrogenase family protein [Bacteroidota bacterium]
MQQSSNISFTEIKNVFDKQQNNLHRLIAITATDRIKKLKRLRETILSHQQDFRDAMFADYRKPAPEVDLIEIYVILTEIKQAIKNLYRWTGKQKVKTPFSLFGTSSYIQYEPKGLTLVIAPWNFPIQLSICPLVSSIAAGNAVILKPSEFTPQTSSLIKKVLFEVFPENEVAVIEGNAEVATYLLSLKFNHIFFTGSSSVGKIVMKAAAEHLASVTLELGGKSPVIVDDTADIETAARRIASGKLTNCGQVCLAPDYAFVHQSKKVDFLSAYEKQVKKMYGGSDQALLSGDYTRIVNSNHLLRLKRYLDDAVQKGANIELGGVIIDFENYFSPTVLTNLKEDMLVAQEEIFGPILLVYTYTDLTEVIRHINSKEKPLALYIFSASKRTINLLLGKISAGGVTVNDIAIHFYNHNLPFGGVNNSGIGKGHGEWAFREFSNAKGVLTQWSPIPIIEMMYPPFTKGTKKLIDFTLKWF